VVLGLTNGFSYTFTVTASSGGHTATSTGNSAVVLGLTNGFSYTFTVTASNAVGTSTSSGTSNAITPATVPGAPTNLAATVQDSSIDLSWTAPASNGGTPITDYVIEYKLSSGGTWATFSDGVSTSPFVTVTSLSNDNSYDFRVVAKNLIGLGASSTPVSATPGAPAQVLIQGFSNTTVPTIGTNVRITNEGSVAYEYQYTWCITDSSSNQCGGGDDIFSSTAAKLVQPAENFDTTLNSTVPTPGNYWFHINVNFGSDSSQASQSFTAIPSGPATAPGAPTIGTATAGDGQAVVTFSAPISNGGSAITYYTVTSDIGNFVVYGASSPITITGLSNGTAYTFTVTATNAVGTSTASSVSNSVTPAAASNGNTGGGSSGGGGGGGGGGSSTPVPISNVPGTYKLSDLNNDGKVNSVDFSILLAFWKTKGPFKNPKVDINKDGKVDSIDFSIMLYDWDKRNF
jgi:hypothetical protein